METLEIIAIGFLFIIFLVRISSAPKITNHPSRGKTIIAFGDSLIKGTGSTEGNDFVSLLEDEIGKSIINFGVPGETSEQGLKRVHSVIAKDPKIVLVLFGGNDFIRGIKMEETFKNVDTIIEKIQSAGAVVLLLGIQGGILTDPYAIYFKEIAKKRGALYVPNVLENLIGNETLMNDEIHPNDRGYRIIADKVYPTLAKAF